MANPDLRHRIARHYSDVFRLFGQNAESGVFEEGSGWRRILTRLPHFIANMAIFEKADDLSPLESAVKPLVDPCFPSSALFELGEVPRDAAQFLVGNGFAHLGGMPLMAVENAKLEETALPDGVAFVEFNRDEASLWGQAMEQGFGLPAGIGAMCAAAAKSDQVRLFGARENGRILSTSMLFLHDGLAGIYCVATLPEARSRGLGAHVTAEPLRIAAKEGFETGILQSSEAGYPVYRKLGFSEIGSMPVYVRRVETGHGPS